MTMQVNDIQITPHKPGQTYFALLLAYLTFVLYGSLVPFRFEAMPIDQAWRYLLNVLQQSPKIISTSDFVANYFLFMPLTFLALGAFTRENSRSFRWLIALIVWIVACVFGSAIEYIQNFFPARTVSLTDIIAQGVGGIIGIILWFWFGRRFTAWTRELWHEYVQGKLMVKILLAYALALTAYLLMPFDLTLSPYVIYHKIKAGSVILVPFSDINADDLWSPLVRLLRMIPIGILTALLIRPQFRYFKGAIKGTLIFAAITESLQLFIISRVTSTTDLAIALVAGIIAGLLMKISFEKFH